MGIYPIFETSASSSLDVTFKIPCNIYDRDLYEILKNSKKFWTTNSSRVIIDGLIVRYMYD